MFDACQLFLETIVSLYGYLEEGVPHIAAVPYLKTSSEMISEAESFPVFFLRSFPRSFKRVAFEAIKTQRGASVSFSPCKYFLPSFLLIISLKALQVPIIS